MNKIFLGAVLLLTLQASDCATAGSIQDSKAEWQAQNGGAK